MNQTNFLFNSFGQILGRCRFLTLSVLIHGLLLVLLGGVVIFRAAVQSESFEVSTSTGEFLEDTFDELTPTPEEPLQEFEVPPEPAFSPSEPPQASAITTLVGNDSIVASNTNVQAFGTRLAGTMSAIPSVENPARTSNSSAPVMSKLKTGTVFGVKIESAKLGVILDMSYSTHSHLVAVVEEIRSKFDDSVLVFYPGCGIKAENPKVKREDGFKVLSLGAAYERAAAEKAPEKMSSIGILKGFQDRDEWKKVDAMITKLSKRDTAFVVSNESKIGMTSHTDLAFERLLDAKVDTIYWFADFADKLDPQMMEKLTKQLRSKKIKVIAHNFLGKPWDEKNASHAEVLKLAKQTGGEALSKIPK